MIIYQKKFRKLHDKIQYTFMISTLSKVGIQNIFTKLIKYLQNDRAHAWKIFKIPLVSRW